MCVRFTDAIRFDYKSFLRLLELPHNIVAFGSSIWTNSSHFFVVITVAAAAAAVLLCKCVYCSVDCLAWLLLFFLAADYNLLNTFSQCYFGFSPFFSKRDMCVCLPSFYFAFDSIHFDVSV